MKTRNTVLISFMLGTITGMMYAPEKGTKLRKQIKCKMKNGLETTKNMTTNNNLKNKIDKIEEKIQNLDLEKTKENLTKEAEKIKIELEEIIIDAKNTKDDLLENAATKLKTVLKETKEELLEILKD